MHDTPEKAEQRRELEEALAAYEGEITIVPGFEKVVPKRRTDWVDPEAARPKPAKRPELGPWMTERRRQAYEAKKARNAAARGEG